MILGAVLAGGASRRFGSDKALALLDGESLIARVIAALGGQVDAVAVCGRDWPGLSLRDRPAPGLGPLGGLAAALHHAHARSFAHVVSVPCDAALLPADLVARLAGDGPAFAAAQPVVGWWPATLAPMLDAFVASDPRRSLKGWAAACGARRVEITLPNVNTPADLAALNPR